MLNDYAKFDGLLSERDHLAIRKTFSGMMKLIYPDGKIKDEEAKELIDFLAEGRKRVKDQLYVIDSTFCTEPAKFEYTWLKSGETIKVEHLKISSTGQSIRWRITMGRIWIKTMDRKISTKQEWLVLGLA